MNCLDSTLILGDLTVTGKVRGQSDSVTTNNKLNLGPTGPTGPTGSVGPTGPTGPTGYSQIVVNTLNQNHLCLVLLT